MLRRIAPVLALGLGLGLAPGCAKPPPPPTLSPAASDTVEDQGATFEVEVKWQRVGANEIKLVTVLAARGIEQTDSLVLDVTSSGFVITEGSREWVGFVKPREKYTHEVSYMMIDDEDSGRLDLGIRRSMDGTPLWGTELLFRREAGGITLAQ
ncbi:MAG: hypothetical protein AB1Z98_36735 [Nannocystaceae bacterium]